MHLRESVKMMKVEGRGGRNPKAQKMAYSSAVKIVVPGGRQA